MIANINNFGVINFYENNGSKQEPTRQSEPVCEDVTPVNDTSSVTSECHSDTPPSSASSNGLKDILPTPKEGKYSEVRRYIEERCKFDKEFKNFCDHHSRVELCNRLTKEFGWLVDHKSLGRNINRN